MRDRSLGRLHCSCSYDAASDSAAVAWDYVEDSPTNTVRVDAKERQADETRKPVRRSSDGARAAMPRAKSASSSSSEPKLGMRLAALLAYREDALKRADSITEAAAAAVAISGTFGLGDPNPGGSSAVLRRRRSSQGRGSGIGGSGSSAWRAEAAKAGADAAAIRARRAQVIGASSLATTLGGQEGGALTSGARQQQPAPSPLHHRSRSAGSLQQRSAGAGPGGGQWQSGERQSSPGVSVTAQSVTDEWQVELAREAERARAAVRAVAGGGDVAGEDQQHADEGALNSCAYASRACASRARPGAAAASRSGAASREAAASRPAVSKEQGEGSNDPWEAEMAAEAARARQSMREAMSMQRGSEGGRHGGTVPTT